MTVEESRQTQGAGSAAAGLLVGEEELEGARQLPPTLTSCSEARFANTPARERVRRKFRESGDIVQTDPNGVLGLCLLQQGASERVWEILRNEEREIERGKILQIVATGKAAVVAAAAIAVISAAETLWRLQNQSAATST